MNITAETLTELFLQAPIPTSVATDGINGDPTRTGTNLLTYSEAQEIFEWMLRELGKPADINLPDDLKDQEDKVKPPKQTGGIKNTSKVMALTEKCGFLQTRNATMSCPNLRILPITPKVRRCLKRIVLHF